MEMKTSNKQFDDVKSSIHTEALKLADELIKGELIDIYEKYTQQWKKDKVSEASAMIRRLVEENDRIIRDLIGASLYEHDYKTLIEKLKPLSDEEIIKVFEGNFNPNSDGTINSEVLAFARAIEERHGIK